MLLWTAIVFFLLLTIYLWHANRAISTAPPQADNLRQKDWTKEEIEEAYQAALTSPTDVKPFLFSKKSRRYVVTGGSGLVGGWIVHHLLMRGEDPQAIRIVDISPTQREEAIQANIDFVKTDVSDPDAVDRAFNRSWPDPVKSLPLTVFHCVAYIHPSEREPDFLARYIKVNVQGTKNVLHSAQAAGASCFVGTSSASVSLKPPSFFPWPWQRWPRDIYQFHPNADPKSLDAPLESFGSCYAWSKAQAEKLIRAANNPSTGFLTGALRPGHAIYGHGVDNPSSLTWDYLRRGGNPTWISRVVAHFVCAQNVSIAHLAYENALINKTNPGGKAYCVTDPNPPIRYGNLYDTLGQLAHPLTPVQFQPVAHIVVLLVAYAIEAYVILQHRHLRFLPVVTGDAYYAQPAMFNMCALHVIYTDTAAQEEIGYRAPITTKEGFALAMVDWNQKVDARTKKAVAEGKGSEVHVQEQTTMPKGPNVH